MRCAISSSRNVPSGRFEWPIVNTMPFGSVRVLAAMRLWMRARPAGCTGRSATFSDWRPSAGMTIILFWSSVTGGFPMSLRMEWTPAAGRILDAADRLLARYGYQKMTVDDLAREAGIGKGTVYLSFPGKSE